MGTHPNAILLLTLTPEGLARKTMRAIEAELGIDAEADAKIGGINYHRQIMESDYDEDWQLPGKEGDLLFFDMVTYGYGEAITWDKLEAQKRELDLWAQSICERHHCTYVISVTANYW